jgi:hypothetical protein
VIGQIILGLAEILALLGAMLVIWFGVNRIVLIAMRAFPLVRQRRR